MSVNVPERSSEVVHKTPVVGLYNILQQAETPQVVLQTLVLQSQVDKSRGLSALVVNEPWQYLLYTQVPAPGTPVNTEPEQPFTEVTVPIQVV